MADIPESDLCKEMISHPPFFARPVRCRRRGSHGGYCKQHSPEGMTNRAASNKTRYAERQRKERHLRVSGAQLVFHAAESLATELRRGMKGGMALENYQELLDDLEEELSNVKHWLSTGETP